MAAPAAAPAEWRTLYDALPHTQEYTEAEWLREKKQGTLRWDRAWVVRGVTASAGERFYHDRLRAAFLERGPAPFLPAVVSASRNAPTKTRFYGYAKKMTISEYIDAVHGAEGPYYASAFALQRTSDWGEVQRPDPFPLQLSDAGSGVIALPDADGPKYANMFVIFGAEGTYTLEHQDHDAFGVFSTVLSGEKLFVQHPPVYSEEGLPLFTAARDTPLSAPFDPQQLQGLVDAESVASLVSPGSFVYTPPGWLHSVLNVKPLTLGLFYRALLTPMLPTVLQTHVYRYQCDWGRVLTAAVVRIELMLKEAEGKESGRAARALQTQATNELACIQLLLAYAKGKTDFKGLTAKTRTPLVNYIKDLFVKA